MVIDQFCLNVAPGKGPVEIIGEFDELQEVARVFGWRSPTCWRVSLLSVIDHARGKTPNVLLTRNEAVTLCKKAAAIAMATIEDEFLVQRPQRPAAIDTGILAIDVATADVIVDTILSYAHASPPRHEPL